MIDLNGQKWQPIILGSYSAVIAIALLLVLTKPSAKQFPQDFGLQSWREIKSDRLNEYPQITEGRKLREKKPDLEMEIYFLANSRGDNLRLIERYQEVTLEPKDLEVDSERKIGFYGLWVQNNRTHLNTCIHSSGKTAFTPQQFSKLVNADLSSRMLPWIFGLTDLRNWDCFWVNMSVSTRQITQKEAKGLLEQKLLVLSGSVAELSKY